MEIETSKNEVRHQNFWLEGWVGGDDPEEIYNLIF
jgi:hypothetical protein